MLRFVRASGAFAMAILMVMAFVVNAQAQSPGTAFTYQGELASGGVLVSDSCNFQFALYDTPTAGTQIGGTLAKPGVVVTNGVFSVMLDFGAGSFTGAPRWLSIAVQCSGDAALAQLAPRQEMTPAPYAVYAATTPWSGVTGKPAWATTGYAAGAGLTLTGATFAVDPAVVQTRVNGACPADQAIRQVNQDGTVVCVTAPTGPAGPPGAQGPAGPDGAQGPAGADGADGAVGPVGPAGPAGADGADGAVGAQGPIGPIGPAGPAGAVGPAGPAGPPGADGADGAVGPAGADGAVGPVGPAGPAGADGADGAQGPAGPVGPVGPAGPAGADGADGADGAVGPVGPAGAQGPVGPAGADGADGADGAVGVQGPIGPIGPPGAPGSEGPQGPEGPEGPQGADGAVGAQGPTGPAGADGAVGAQGPAGPQGVGFRTDCAANQISRWNGSAWICSTETDANAWALTGNGGTSAATNFLGTTDNVAVTVKVNSTTGLRVAPGTDGSDAGTTVTPNIIGGDATNTIPTTVEASTIGGGVGNSITASYATIPGGYGASATQPGQMAYASGSFAAAGDAQASTYIVRRTTTGNQSNQMLYLDGVSLPLAVPVGKTWTFIITISGRSSNGVTAGYVIMGAVENVGGTTALVGTPVNVASNILAAPGFEDIPGWASDVVANNSTDSLDITVTTSGLGGGTQTRWVARVETVEVATP